MIDYLLKSVLILLVIIISGCQTHESPQEIIRPVMVMTASEPGRTLTRVFPGKISPAREVNLSFRVSNRMTHFPVKEGQFVKSGEVIASMDPRDFETAIRNIRGNLDEARANLKAMQAGARLEDIRSLESKLTAARTAMNEANLQYERYLELHRTGAVATSLLDSARSRQEEARSNVRSLEMELEKALTGARDEDIEAMQARIRSLEAGLDEARAALEDSVLRAPFDGFVAEKYVDSHDNISAGQPVVRLQDMSRLEISAGLPEQLMVRKHAIQSIHILLETFPQHFFPARIKEITTDASAMTMTYRLTAVMDRPLDIPVYPSMAADMYIAFSAESGSGNIVVPETALVSRDGSRSSLWIFDPDTDTVSSREVESGEMTRDGIQIVQGIRPGEIFVSAGADFLEEGQKVRVIRDQ